MEKKYLSFEDLIVWQESMKLCCDLYAELKSCKDFSMKDQIQRSSSSVPTNISEGFEHQSDKVYIKHFYIAKGSCGELRTLLNIAMTVQLIEKSRCCDYIARAKRISGMLQNMITSKKAAMKLKNKKSI